MGLDQAEWQAWRRGGHGGAGEERDRQDGRGRCPASWQQRALGYIDNSGNIGRRLPIIPTNRKVIESDTQLSKKLRKEMPSILRKCNEAYLGMVEQYGKRDIWTVLPKMFIDQQREMQAQSNSIVGFMAQPQRFDFPPASASPEEINRSYYVLEREFLEQWEEYCKHSGLKKLVWCSDVYTAPLMQFGVSVEKGVRREWWRRS